MATVSASEMAEAKTPKRTRKSNLNISEEKIAFDQSMNDNKSIVKNDNHKPIIEVILERLGLLFVFIIYYITFCELFRFGFVQFKNLAKDAFLYRYQVLFDSGAMFLGFIGTFLSVLVLTVFFFGTTDAIIRKCVNHFEKNRNRSGEWWEDFHDINFVISATIVYAFAAICLVTTVELTTFMFTDLDWLNLSKDRWIVYRISGVFILVLCSIVYIFNMPFLVPRPKLYQYLLNAFRDYERKLNELHVSSLE